MNQEMNDVPEYRQVQNAPSKNSEKEAWRDGYNQAIQDIKTGMSELRMQKRCNMTADYSWAFDDIDFLLSHHQIRNVK